MNQQKRPFYSGLIHGIPIGLGYLAVSFTFGIMAVSSGLSVFQSVLISLTNLTSAGQFAGLGIITAGSSYLEMAAVQLVINLRYCLMSCSLSQKLDHKMPLFHRFLMAYGVTDEIFGVSVCHPGTLSPFYSYGLMSAAVPGWTLGTLLGALSGSLLPERLLNALGVALYGMFLAIIVPPARENRILRAVVLLSMTASFVFTLIPVLNKEIPLKAHAHQANDLCTALRIAREFDLDITLEHVTEGHMIVDELAKENVPLAVGPTFGHASKFELQNKTWETPGVLAKAGCHVSIITDAPVIPLHYLPLCAGLAMKAGMDEYDALRAITINPAEHIGVADRVGSLEEGKDADIVIMDGTPFTVEGVVKHVFIDGEEI